MSNDPLAMFWIVGVVTQCQRERMSSGVAVTQGGPGDYPWKIAMVR